VRIQLWKYPNGEESGWWYTYPSVGMIIYSQYMDFFKAMFNVPNHQPDHHRWELPTFNLPPSVVSLKVSSSGSSIPVGDNGSRVRMVGSLLIRLMNLAQGDPEKRGTLLGEFAGMSWTFLNAHHKVGEMMKRYEKDGKM